MTGFCTLDKKGKVKEKYFLTGNLKKYLSMDEFKKLSYALTPILQRRKKDLKMYDFVLNSGAILHVGFRHLINNEYEIYLMAHISAIMKDMFNHIKLI